MLSGSSPCTTSRTWGGLDMDGDALRRKIRHLTAEIETLTRRNDHLQKLLEVFKGYVREQEHPASATQPAEAGKSSDLDVVAALHSNGDGAPPR